MQAPVRYTEKNASIGSTEDEFVFNATSSRFDKRLLITKVSSALHHVIVQSVTCLTTIPPKLWATKTIGR